MEQNNITWIPAHKLKPHPDNPRKNLGDLTELTDSIKKNGILQNLTVVPDPDAKEGEGYLIVIGHRRNAAGTAAGLKEFPCVIRNLSHADQCKMMLCENIQRNDLTVIEQAQGFQMMIDFGITVEELSKDTGFAQSTIYHRLNIAKLDQKKLSKNMDQLTIKDLIELEKIDDVEKRNKLLEENSGRVDFRQRVKSAFREQEVKKLSKTIRKKCIAAGLKEKKANNWDAAVGEYSSQYIEPDTDPEKIKLKKKGVAYTHFSINEYGNFMLYTLKKEEKKPAKTEAEKRMKQIEKEIKGLYEEINGRAHLITESIKCFLSEAEDHENGFEPEATNQFVAGAFLYLLVEQPYLYRFPTLDAQKLGAKRPWNYDRDDSERYIKSFNDVKSVLMRGKEASPIKCASLFLTGMASYVTDEEKITDTCQPWSWRNGRILREDGMYELNSAIDITSKLGFALDEEQEQLLQSKGSAFDRIAELAKEYDNLEKESRS